MKLSLLIKNRAVEIIEESNPTSWSDLELEPETDVASQLSVHVLVGRVISSQALSKHMLHATMKSA